MSVCCLTNKGKIVFTYILGSLIRKLKCIEFNILKIIICYLNTVLDTLFPKKWLKFVTHLPKRHTNSLITTKWNIFSGP